MIDAPMCPSCAIKDERYRQLQESIKRLIDNEVRAAQEAMANLREQYASVCEWFEIQNQIINDVAELRQALNPVIDWLAWIDNWPGEFEEDDAIIAVPASAAPKASIRIKHLRRLCSLTLGYATPYPEPEPDTPVTAEGRLSSDTPVTIEG